jgi:hypothetical protein
MQIGKCIRVFVFSTGILLIITAAAKLVSAFGSSRILQNLDPIFGISFQHLFEVVGGLECFIALYCLFSRRIEVIVGLLAWLSTSFLIYRIGLEAVGYHRPCSCMGNLTDAIHVSARIADTTMKAVLAYLLVGSYAILFWLWRQKRKAFTVVRSP